MIYRICSMFMGAQHAPDPRSALGGSQRETRREASEAGGHPKTELEPWNREIHEKIFAFLGEILDTSIESEDKLKILRLGGGTWCGKPRKDPGSEGNTMDFKQQWSDRIILDTNLENSTRW